MKLLFGQKNEFLEERLELVRCALLDHVDVLEDGSDDGVDVSLAKIGQLDGNEEEAELSKGKLLVGGHEVVGQALATEIGEEAAIALNNRTTGLCL